MYYIGSVIIIIVIIIIGRRDVDLITMTNNALLFRVTPSVFSGGQTYMTCVREKQISK